MLERLFTQSETRWFDVLSCNAGSQGKRCWGKHELSAARWEVVMVPFRQAELGPLRLGSIIQHRYRWRCEERRAATAFCVCKVYKDDDRLLSNTIEGQSLCMFNKCMTRGCLHYTALSVATILMGVSSCLEKANANGTGNICLFSSLSLMWIFGPHLYV